MSEERKGLETYYREKYAKKQFTFEKTCPESPDFRITDGKTISGKDILVIGCNTGNDIIFLTKENNVKGIDIMQDAVDVAKQHLIDAQQLDVEKGLPFSSEQFDIVICKEVLEHLIDPEFVMKEIWRVLKKNGFAFISVPNHFWYYFRFRILLGKGLIMPWDAGSWHNWDYFHIRFFTFKGINDLIRKTNFIPIRFYYQETISDVFAPGKLKHFDKYSSKRVLRFLVKSKPDLFSRDFVAKIKKMKI